MPLVPQICVNLKQNFWNTIRVRVESSESSQNCKRLLPPFAILAVRSTEILFIYALRYRYRYICICKQTDAHYSCNKTRENKNTKTITATTWSCSKNKWKKIYSHIAHISMPLSDKVMQLDSDSDSIDIQILCANKYAFFSIFSIYPNLVRISRCSFHFVFVCFALLVYLFSFSTICQFLSCKWKWRQLLYLPKALAFFSVIFWLSLTFKVSTYSRCY